MPEHTLIIERGVGVYVENVPGCPKDYHGS